MEELQERERFYPYCSEVTDKVELSSEDYERGQAFIEGIAGLNRAFTGIDDLRFDCSGSSLNDAIMIVEPQSPVRRTITRSDGFYEWTVTPETTESMEPLIISFFKTTYQKGTDSFIVEGYSPSYRVSTLGYDSLPLMETSQFDPALHRVAIYIKDTN